MNMNMETETKEVKETKERFEKFKEFKAINLTTIAKGSGIFKSSFISYEEIKMSERIVKDSETPEYWFFNEETEELFSLKISNMDIVNDSYIYILILNDVYMNKKVYAMSIGKNKYSIYNNSKKKSKKASGFLAFEKPTTEKEETDTAESSVPEVKEETKYPLKKTTAEERAELERIKKEYHLEKKKPSFEEMEEELEEDKQIIDLPEDNTPDEHDPNKLPGYSYSSKKVKKPKRHYNRKNDPVKNHLVMDVTERTMYEKNTLWQASTAKDKVYKVGLIKEGSSTFRIIIKVADKNKATDILFDNLDALKTKYPYLFKTTPSSNNKYQLQIPIDEDTRMYYIKQMNAEKARPAQYRRATITDTELDKLIVRYNELEKKVKVASKK